METIRLSSKGQVVIPKHIRDAHHWNAGTELQLIEVEGGVLLKPSQPFALTHLDEVAGCLHYSGPTKTEDEIVAAMKLAAKRAWRDSN